MNSLRALYARHRERVETGITYTLYVLCAVVWAAVAVHAFGLSFMPDLAEWAGHLIAGWLWS